MSQYSYEGDFINPAGSFIVVPNPNEEKGGYIIAVKVSTNDILQELINGAITSEEAYNLRLKGWRPHTNNTVFEDEDQAVEWIEGLEEFFEQDYEDYLEENHHSIVQMERYEMWRNEY